MAGKKKADEGSRRPRTLRNRGERIPAPQKRKKTRHSHSRKGGQQGFSWFGMTEPCEKKKTEYCRGHFKEGPAQAPKGENTEKP